MTERLDVTSTELRRAIQVWLRVMPKHIWRALEKHHLAALEKRQDEDPPVHTAVAEHIVSHFQRARWEVTKPEPSSGLGSPPPWSGFKELEGR